MNHEGPSKHYSIVLRKVEIESGVMVELMSTKSLLTGWRSLYLVPGVEWRRQPELELKFKGLSPILTARCASIVRIISMERFIELVFRV